MRNQQQVFGYTSLQYIIVKCIYILHITHIYIYIHDTYFKSSLALFQSQFHGDFTSSLVPGTKIPDKVMCNSTRTRVYGDQSWIYLAKLCCDRTLFSRALESWFL